MNIKMNGFKLGGIVIATVGYVLYNFDVFSFEKAIVVIVLGIAFIVLGNE